MDFLTLSKIGGSLLGSLLGSSGGETHKRIVDPFTNQANAENQQQKALNKNLYQADLASANRTTNKMISDIGKQSIGAQAQMGMSDTTNTNALKAMATGNFGKDLLDQSANATGRYAENMFKTNEFTKGLADQTIHRFNQGAPNWADSVGSTLMNLGSFAANSAYEADTMKNLRAGEKGVPSIFEILFGM